MHYYQFHIGDYVAHTRHLSLIEDIAYRRLLDFYYLHEEPIRQREIARQIGMRDNEQEVLSVLEEFFVSTEHGYINPRADREIEHFHAKVEQASRAGRASAERRLNGRSTDRSTDVQPTNNQEPITKNQIKKAAVAAPPEGVSQSVWEDFVQLRKVKKAPITSSALSGIMREATKARWSLEQALTECCARGWVGFKAEWVQGPPSTGLTVPSRQERDPVLVKMEEDRKKAAPISPEIRQQLQSILRR